MRLFKSVALNYVYFAAISTLLNLGAQAAILASCKSECLAIAVFCGTLVGLISKYLLDKLYIFDNKAVSMSKVAKQFGVYTFFGIGTTLIFWFTEAAFSQIFNSTNMTLLGGAIGLSIGYLLKYQLDKHFTFKGNV